MKHEVTQPVGAVVTDVDPAHLTTEEVAQLVQLLAEHGVLVLPDQQLDDDAFTAFLRRFGDLTFTEGELPLEGHPDLNVISNVGRTTPPRSSFHVDTSYVAVPPAYTALRAVAIPEAGGATQFSNQYTAHDTLPEPWRERLAGRTATHVVTGLDDADLSEEAETSAEHPLLHTHPVSGRDALYLSTAQRVTAISGMDEAEAGEAVAFLLEHSTRPENVLDHAWAPADLVIWDNRVVLHRADHAGVVGDRVMHRGMVAGTEPLVPAGVVREQVASGRLDA